MVSEASGGEMTLLKEDFSTFLSVVKWTNDVLFGKGLPRLGSRFQKAFCHCSYTGHKVKPHHLPHADSTGRVSARTKKKNTGCEFSSFLRYSSEPLLRWR